MIVMNDFTLAMPNNLAALHVGEMLALPGLQSGRQEQHLSATAAQIVRGIASVVDELVLASIEPRTPAEFIANRNEVFPKYFHAVRAVSDLARIIVPRRILDVLAAESFSEMEAEFRDHGLDAFGAAVRDQALFTVWTVRKISDLCQRIDRFKVSEEHLNSDSEVFQRFAFHALSARFHLDCLLKSMRLEKPMYPEVLDAVMDGLRNAVNAYAWARRAFDLRTATPEPLLAAIEWDDEERQLLDEATFDLVGEEF